MTATASARGRANRRRGASTEVMVVNWLRAHGHPDARRYLAGDGRQPGDIDGVPGLVIEVKGVQAGSRWPTWCRQARAEAQGTPWCVVRRQPGVTDVGRWPCVASSLAVPLSPCTDGIGATTALVRAGQCGDWYMFRCAQIGFAVSAGRFGWLFDGAEP